MSYSKIGTIEPENVVIVNKVEHLPTPTDTGDGLGLAYHLEDKIQYFFGNDMTLLYPIVMSNSTIFGTVGTYITYVGSGALFRNNANSLSGISSIFLINFIGTGTNQLYNITSGTVVQNDFVVTFNFAGGTVNGLTSGFYLRNSDMELQKGTFNFGSEINFLNGTVFNPQTSIGAPLVAITNLNSTDIRNTKLIPIAGDAAFNFTDSSGRVIVADCQIVKDFGGIAFTSSSLDQTDPRIDFSQVVGHPDSQTIGSLYMERNTTVTNPTIQGETRTITAFADAGGGQVTVTSAGHGLSNGADVWIANSANYNSKYTISNVATNTFEITETYAAESPLPITTWETGWTKVAGTTYAGENERADMTANNEITFANLEEQKVYINVSTNPSNDSIAAAKDWEFCVIKNDVERLRGSIKFQEMTDKAREGFILSTSTAITGDKFSVYTRNLSDTITNSVMVNMSSVIKG